LNQCQKACGWGWGRRRCGEARKKEARGEGREEFWSGSLNAFINYQRMKKIMRTRNLLADMNDIFGHEWPSGICAWAKSGQARSFVLIRFVLGVPYMILKCPPSPPTCATLTKASVVITELFGIIIIRLIVLLDARAGAALCAHGRTAQQGKTA
jgi:hypothetical protein